MNPDRWLSWRPQSWLALAALALPSAASADLVKITSINGHYDPNHSTIVEVSPGDVVSLDADIFSEEYHDGSYQYVEQNRYADEFIWSADDRYDNECDAGDPARCGSISTFEVTDYGVNFYVPYDAGQDITITVRHRSNWSTDQITLRSRYGYGNRERPSRVVHDPEDYSYNDLNPDYALAGNGNWVVISGMRYWVPVRYRSDWAPYRHGHWSWTTPHGWTWVSYDPWGWYTDHYGLWRYHGSYGWVWTPFADRQYRPHTVTWFHQNDYVGWYPYYDGYRQGYRHGYADGFRDGYWDGYTAGRYYGVNDRYGFYGFTVVRRTSFGHRNIFDVFLSDRALRLRCYRNAYGAGWYGRYPGGASLAASRTWIYSRANVVRTSVHVRRVGSANLHYARRPYAVPDSYRAVRSTRRVGARYPVGTVVRPPARAGGRPVVIPPTRDGRGISHPPTYRDRNGGVHRRDPRTRQPGRPNPDNPVYRPPNRRPPGARPSPGNPGRDPVVRPTPPRPRPGNPGGRRPPATRPNPGPNPRPGRPPVTRPNPGPNPRPGRPPVTRPNPGPRPGPGRPPEARPPRRNPGRGGGGRLDPAPAPRPPRTRPPSNGGGGGRVRPAPRPRPAPGRPPAGGGGRRGPRR